VREQYRIPADAFVVGSIGRLEPIKRHDEAFRIFASLGSETAPSEPHFLLVGSGGDESSLRHLAQALGIANRVHFCGFVPDESRADYYSAMDCFLMVSKAEGLGMTLIEAMACECPVVATNSGGPSEVLIREDLGWLVPQDDWGRVRAAVEAAQAMPSAHRQRRVEAAREFVVSRFDSNTQNDILATLIEQA
jgi:glycosyltransferase involved in cell wall biosynthesis